MVPLCGAGSACGAGSHPHREIDLYASSSNARGTAGDPPFTSLLVSFIVGRLNAWCYMWTHRGLSYTRTFTQSLILITMIVDLSMSMVAMNVPDGASSDQNHLSHANVLPDGGA